MKFRISKKAVALSLAIVLAFGCGVGGTLAWLTDDTDEVEDYHNYEDELYLYEADGYIIGSVLPLIE